MRPFRFMASLRRLLLWGFLAAMLAGSLAGCAALKKKKEEPESPPSIQEWLGRPRPGF